MQAKQRFVVHKCKFVDWKGQAITATAFSYSCKSLAVGRSDGSIEIWNVEHEWFLHSVRILIFVFFLLITFLT